MTRLLNFVRRPGDSTPMYIGPEDIVSAARALGSMDVKQRGWDRHSPFEAEITWLEWVERRYVVIDEGCWAGGYQAEWQYRPVAHG